MQPDLPPVPPAAPDTLTGPGGLTMRQIHEATLKSLAVDQRAAPSAQPLGWWQRLQRWWAHVRADH